MTATDFRPAGVKSRAGGALALLVGIAAALGAFAAYRPVVAVVLAGGLVAAYLLVARPEAGLLVLIAAFPLQWSFRIFPSAGLLTPIKIIAAISLAAFAAHFAIRQPRLRADPLVFVLLGLLGLAALSGSVAGSPFTGPVAGLLGFTALYLMAGQLGSAALLPRAIWVFTASTGIAAGIALWEFFAGITSIVRPAVADPNDFALVLAVAVPFGAWLAMSSRGWRRATAVTLTTVISVAVLLTLSRGALLGLGAGILWHLATVPSHRRFLLSGLTVLAGSTAVVLLAARPLVKEALAQKSEVWEANIESRIASWKVAWDLAADHPVLGIGPGYFGDYYRSVTEAPAHWITVTVSHNTYLDLAAESGLLALALIAVFLAVTWLRVSRAVRADIFAIGPASFLRTSLVVAVVAAWFTSQQYNAPIWLLGGLIAMLRPEKS